MALKDSWVDKKDEVDYILAKDINAVAHGVIDIEENLPKTIEEKLGEAKESGEFDGKDGLSAYELAIKNGTTTAKSEAEWLSSLKGDKGDKGDTGNTPDLLYHYLADGNVIMPETAVTFDSRAGAYLMDKYTLTVGKEYFVITNGVKTKATAVECDGGVMLGVAIGDYDAGTYESYRIECYDTVHWVNGSYCYTTISNAFRANASATIAILDVDYKIDPKYIPDMYYTEDGGTVEILPTSTAIDTGNAIMGELYVFGDPITLVEGKTYKVIYNGVEYECVATASEVQGESCILLGDVAALETGAPSGAYPFLMATADFVVSLGACIAVIPLDGSTSITVSIVGYGTIIHKVPDTYLPKTPVVYFEEYGARIDSNLITSQRLTNEALEELLSNIAAVSDKIEIHVNDLALSTPNGIPVKYTFYKTEMIDYYQEPEYAFACPTFGGVYILHWGTGDGYISLTVRQYK